LPRLILFCPRRRVRLRCIPLAQSLVTLEELQDSYWNLDNFISDIFGQRLYNLRARLWIYCLNLQNIPPLSDNLGYTGSSLHLNHFWSLAVEEQFYILWPFLLTRMKNLKEARWFDFALRIRIP